MRRSVIRILFACTVLGVSLLLGGCWGKNFWRAQDAALVTADMVDSLLEENAILQRRIYHLETMLEGQQEQLRRSSAGTSMDLEEIKDQINALQVLLEETQRTPVRESVRYPTAQQQAVQVNAPPPESTTDTGGGAGPTAADTASVELPSPEEMHRQIYLDFSRMEYEIALEESEVFLREYPVDPLTEDVRFIRGECFLELKKDLDALKEFSKILQDYPRGRKTPAVLLRMAITYDRTGDSELAAGVAGRLLREYPDSEEAAEARGRFGETPDDQ